jgi:phosphatidylglycerophosphatase A
VVVLLPWAGWLAAFLLFRGFDIVKPPPLKRLATLPAGWGIMADDLGAAVYSVFVLLLIRWLGDTIIR